MAPQAPSAPTSTPSAVEQPAWAAELIAAARALGAARQPAPQAPASIQPIEDDAIMTGRDFNRQADRLYQQRLAPDINAAWEMAAGATQSAAELRYADEFRRYGSEIKGELAKLPAQMRTLDNIGQVVTLVKGRHADEYAREIAQQLVTQMDTTIRPSGGGSGPTPQTIAPSPFESDDIPADWKQRAKQAGITERTITEFCAGNDITPEDFWKLFPKGSSLQPIVAEAGHAR